MSLSLISSSLELFLLTPGNWDQLGKSDFFFYYDKLSESSNLGGKEIHLTCCFASPNPRLCSSIDLHSVRMASGVAQKERSHSGAGSNESGCTQLDFCSQPSRGIYFLRAHMQWHRHILLGSASNHHSWIIFLSSSSFSW